MDATLTPGCNAVIAPNEEVWHLGDVACRGGDVPALLDRLHVRKHLIRGNNDPDATLEAAGWASVGDFAKISIVR